MTAQLSQPNLLPMNGELGNQHLRDFQDNSIRFRALRSSIVYSP